MNESNNVNAAVITWNGQTYMFALDTTSIQLAKNEAGVSLVALEPLGTNEIYRNFMLRLRHVNGGQTANE